MAAEMTNLKKLPEDEVSVGSIDSLTVTEQPKPGCLSRKPVQAGLAILLIGAIVAGFTVFILAHKASAPAVPHTISFKFTSKFKTGPKYVGMVHKTEDAEGNWKVTGQYSYRTEAWNRTTTVSWWDNRVYATSQWDNGDFLSASCLSDGGPVPQNAELSQAYRSAVRLSSDHDQYFGAPSCSSGQEPWVLNLGGDDFVFCDPTDNGVVDLVHEEFTATLYDVSTASDSEPVLTGPPKGRDGQPMQCSQIPSSVVALRASYDDAKRRLASAPAAAPAPRSLRSSPGSMADIEAAVAAAAGTTKRRLPGADHPCYFVHGAGLATTSSPTTTFTSYWGNVHSEIGSGCDSFHFLHMDTTTNGWDSSTLQNAFCDAAAGSHATGGTVPKIRDARIFSFDMGSLIVGAAFVSNRCDLDNSKWFVAGSPLLGTSMANWLQSLCASYQSWMDECNTAYNLCSGSGSSRSLNNGWRSMKTDYSPSGVSLASVRTYMMANTNGVMCGNTAWGLDNDASATYDAIQDYASLPDPNDGFLSLSSCKGATLSDKSWSTSDTKADWFVAGVNHDDLRCINGDGIFEYRKPCEWYKEQA